MAANALHLALDPVFHLADEGVGREAPGVDRRADAHRHEPGPLDEGAPAPQLAGVVRDRDHRRSGLDREPGAADLILPAAARRDARALREDHDAVAAREALP